jgi:hypothetical protein
MLPVQTQPDWEAVESFGFTAECVADMELERCLQGIFSDTGTRNFLCGGQKTLKTVAQGDTCATV